MSLIQLINASGMANDQGAEIVSILTPSVRHHADNGPTGQGKLRACGHV